MRESRYTTQKKYSFQYSITPELNKDRDGWSLSVAVKVGRLDTRHIPIDLIFSTKDEALDYFDANIDDIMENIEFDIKVVPNSVDRAMQAAYLRWMR